MQLVAIAVPSFQKMQRDGESGRKKIAQYTRYLTVAILLFQAPSYLMNLKMQSAGALASGISWTEFMIPATIILAAGSMFILWLGERITDKGVGNGISMIIMIGIVARLPQAFFQEVGSRFTAITSGGLVYCRNPHPLRSNMRCHTSCTGSKEGSRTVCEKGGWKQEPDWWSTTVHSAEAVRCQRDAYHLCTGTHVHTIGYRTVSV